ncbi:hypothetical protein [Pseudoxanthomonas sp.]|uniref:hypothetical protein n=1 Tax=Pseudoxanthomonas sp. TaxID=1871049 RepID=UPI00260E90BE|nr:hypothetical protein [Pseudoxanthomonas sp.]WDS36240.1 MAG: hypothetical protein O8I58_18545 [Pseudoxanthomonas sp.]
MSGDLAQLTSLESVLALQDRMLSLPQIECPLQHYYAWGQYGREMRMQAGDLIVGKAHRYSTLNILLEGQIGIGMPGQEPALMQAPCVFVSEPECKKVMIAVTDVRFMTVHPTKLTDPAEIEAKFIINEHLTPGV